jgi:YegS/Rv2252/BmrU family lipid kinase
MRIFLVVNPGSANGRTGRRWPEIRGQIRRTLGEVREAFTAGPMDAARITSEALREGYDCIVAVGGDGTLNEVANGFFDGGKAINPKAALGLLPRGTGGDFRRTLEWGVDLPSGLERLKGDATTTLDLGLVEFTSNSGERTSRYFVNVCSFGASGLVDREVSKASKLLGGKASFFLGTGRALLKYRDQKVQLALDSEPAQEVSLTTLSAANGRYFGGGMCVAPTAVASDGLLDVTLWSGYGISDFVLKAKALYNGSHVKLDGTRCVQCKSLSAVSGEEVLLDVDGEQPGRLPCRISVIPGAIRVKVAAGAQARPGKSG